MRWPNAIARWPAALRRRGPPVRALAGRARLAARRLVGGWLGAGQRLARRVFGAFGRIRAHVGRAWRSVRPRTRRGAAAVVGLALGVAALGLVGLAGFGWLGREYGFHPQANEATWRALAPVYGTAGWCTSCHAPQQVRLASATHAGIGCQSCHGPLAEHALARPGTPEAAVRVDVPTDDLCVTCHETALGRPTGFRQIDPAEHYVAQCLQCHDPHTGVSRRPPIVQHTLERLPPCVTCHGPDGFKARDQRHPAAETEDAACLACHLEDDQPTAAQWRESP